MKKRINILTHSGYFERFFWHLQNGSITHKEAYLKVEKELIDIGAPPKYTDYHSFRSNKRYHLKIKKRL